MPDIFISPSSQDSAQKKSTISPQVKKEKLSKIISKTFSSYDFMPSDIRFETQGAGESILLLLRKHWVTNIIWLFLSLILIIIPPLAISVFMFNRVIIQSVPIPLLNFLVLGWYLITFTYIFMNFLLWYFNVWIVTNERIIDIEFINLINKKFSETRINKIEDVTMRTGGFIKTIFDFGDVFIQTAAEEAVFGFLSVPHPDKVVKVVNELMGKQEEGGGKS